MGERAWSSAFALDAKIVRRVVREQFPALAPVRARYLSEGWDSRAYLVNDTFVFRFPKRREVEAQLERESKLLAVIAPELELAVPAPRFFGRRTPLYPLRFAGYPMIAGTPAAECRVTMRDEPKLARQLARFLAALHAVRVPRGLSLPRGAVPRDLTDTQRVGLRCRLSGARDPVFSKPFPPGFLPSHDVG